MRAPYDAVTLATGAISANPMSETKPIESGGSPAWGGSRDDVPERAGERDRHHQAGGGGDRLKDRLCHRA